MFLLSVIKLSKEGSASGILISISKNDQTEEKFEETESLVNLFDRNLRNLEELWEPITKKFPELTFKRMPVLLKSLDKLNLYLLKERLNTLTKPKSVRKNNPESIISWSAAL